MKIKFGTGGCYCMNGIIERLPKDVQTDLHLLINQLDNFSLKDNICKMILFGSFSKNTFRPDSDLDIALVLKKIPRDRREYIYCFDIERDLNLILCTEEILETGKYVFDSIRKEGVIIYENV